ncbi:MAG: carbohydrate-binding protein [Propionibacteriaceae bacterium]|jgi:hypothetical protein|nr:carbohydrate-binding protein [Propionibacteriaceae bacterium]
MKTSQKATSVLSLILALAFTFPLVGCSGLNIPGSKSTSFTPLNTTDRPIVANNSVYTERGQLLRGVNNSFIGVEDYQQFVSGTTELINEASNNGLNAIHLYLGGAGDQERPPFAAEASRVDLVIRQAAFARFYVIITIGALSFADVEADTAYLNDFWDFYAPRYRDQANVIYEICNEMGYRDDLDQAIADTYTKIRRQAPATTILLGSSGQETIPEANIGLIKRVEALIDGGIPWTNEAIGFHSYEATEDMYGADWLYHVIEAYWAAGYPLINTETPCRYQLTQYPDIAIYQVLEEMGIAWIAFVNELLITKPSHWRGQFEAAGLTWSPSWGHWPAFGTTYPFAVTPAIPNDSTSAETVWDEGEAVLSFSDGQGVYWRQMNFGARQPQRFQANVKSSAGGSIHIRTVESSAPVHNQFDGPVISGCTVPISDQYVTLTCDIPAVITGIVEIAFTFTGEGSLLLRDWQFVLPSQISYTDPLRVIEAANFPFSSAQIIRTPATDPESAAAQQVEGIADGEFLLYDFVRIRDNQDTIFAIRAKPVAAGAVEVWLGDFGAYTYYLGRCEIDGVRQVWDLYRCDLDLSAVSLWTAPETSNTRWDLKLQFVGQIGVPLFAISEFWFGTTKPKPADIFSPTVVTGTIQGNTASSLTFAGSYLSEFDGLEVIEVGVQCSTSSDFSDSVYTAGDLASLGRFAVTGLDLKPNVETPWLYRAYVKTATTWYYGGTKRIFVS